MNFVITPWDRTDIDALVRVQNQTAQMHPIGKVEMQHDLNVLEDDLQPIVFTAQVGDEVAGFVMASRNPGAYHPQIFGLEIGVMPEHQAQGIGRALYDHMVQHLQALGLLALNVHVAEANTAGLAFAQRRGYEERKRDFVSILDLATFNDKIYPALPQDIEVKSFAEHDTPEIRRELFDLFCVVRNDVPRNEPATPISFEFFESQVLNAPDIAKSATLFAFSDGRMIGFTGGFHEEAANQLDQWLTAVDRSFRGRNIALGLKVLQAAEARRLGIATVRTDNDTRNAPMLAVNTKLGFVRQPAVLSLRREF